MSEAITPEVSARICNHMNDDHGEAVLLYAQVFGGATSAIASKMLAIDLQGMDLEATVDQEVISVRVNFAEELKNAGEAHHTLVAMMKQARN